MFSYNSSVNILVLRRFIEWLYGLSIVRVTAHVYKRALP